MREHHAELKALDVRVFVVTFESAGHVRRYREHHDVPWPVLRDPSRAAYRAFGMERDPFRTLASPRTGGYYLRQAIRGRLPRLRRSDYAQLGGDVILSASGSVCWSYISREPADRATVEQITGAARDCARR